MIVVAILTVQRDLVHDYRAYERRAAAIMADHGATIERTGVIQSDRDAVYLELAPIREKVVVSTEILVGEEGPDYGGG